MMTDNARRKMKLDNQKFYHWKSIVSESNEFKKLMRKRNIKKTQTKDRYIVSLTTYCIYTNKSLTELVAEAKSEQKNLDEDELNIIDLLEEFRPWMSDQGLGSLTIRTRFNDVITFYRNNRIRIPELERYNPEEEEQLEFSDLPTENDIERAIESSISLSAKALFYFMASSGTGKRETANLTVQDFIDATRDYHGEIDNIENVLLKLEEMDGVVPLFKLTRAKTGTKYHTCCTPQATKAIITLLRSKKDISNDDPLFYYKYGGISKAFHRANFKHGWPKIKNYYYFGSHRLRKRHASLLIRDKGLAHYLQGRVLDKTSRSYFFEDPNRVREEYKKYIPILTIGEAEYYGVSSEGYEELQAENEDLKQKYENLQTIMNEQKEEYERKIAVLENSNSAMNDRMDSLQEQMNAKGLETQMIELQKRAASHELVTSTPGLMEYVMRIFEDQIDFGERKYYSDAEIDDLVRLALATKNRIEQYENTLTEEKLQKQYPEHYTEATEIINKYKEKYVTEDLGVPLSELQNEKVDKALLPFKKQVLEDKKSHDYIDDDIAILILPKEVEEIIDEALGLTDSVEAIYTEGGGIDVVGRFK